MRSKGLGLLLGLCAAFALVPTVPWALAAIFDGVDDRWLSTLGALEVTVPIAFGLAALVLATHGLLVQRELADRLAHEFDAHPGHAYAMPVAAAVPAATATAAPAAGGSHTAGIAVAAGAPEAAPEEQKLGGTMAVRERPAGFGSPQAEASKGDKAKRVGRRYSHRLKGAVRRKVRDNFRF